MICIVFSRAMLKVSVVFHVVELSVGFGDIFVNRPDDSDPALVNWLDDNVIPFG